MRKIYQSKNKVIITTEDGSVYHANYVIVTVSVGVLQSDLIEFVPRLPVSPCMLLLVFFYYIHVHDHVARCAACSNLLIYKIG